MAVSANKTWSAGEVLTASDLNDEFANIYSQGEDLGWPATKAKDLNGQELILDADGDTSMTADTDDQIDFRVGGSDVLVITATDMTFNGSSIVTTAEVRRLGLNQVLHRLSSIEQRTYQIEGNTAFENEVFNF